MLIAMTIVIAKKRKTQKKLKLPIQLALVGQASLVKVCLFEDEGHIHCHNHCVSCKFVKVHGKYLDHHSKYTRWAEIFHQ